MRRSQPPSLACSLPTPSPPELSAGSSQSCTPRSSASRWSSRSKATKPRTPRRTSRPSRTSSKRRHSNPGWQRARNPSRRASCGWSRPRRHSDRTGSRIHKIKGIHRYQSPAPYLPQPSPPNNHHQPFPRRFDFPQTPAQLQQKHAACQRLKTSQKVLSHPGFFFSGLAACTCDTLHTKRTARPAASSPGRRLSLCA